MSRELNLLKHYPFYLSIHLNIQKIFIMDCIVYITLDNCVPISIYPNFNQLFFKFVKRIQFDILDYFFYLEKFSGDLLNSKYY